MDPGKQNGSRYVFFLNRLYRFHVLEEDINCPSRPLYYTDGFFNYIRSAKAEGRDIITMTTRQWYQFLLNKEVLMATDSNGIQEDILCRVERKFPEYEQSFTWEKLYDPFSSKSYNYFFVETSIIIDYYFPFNCF